MNEENNSNNVPQLETGAEQKARELEQYWLDPREDYPEPFYMLEYNGVPFSAIGGIQAISGQKKNGKSFVLTQLMAAILGDCCERTEHFLPGLRVPERTIEYLRDIHHDADYLPRVLYVDTEMERLNSAKVLRRVHWLCNWDMKLPNDRFRVLWLKNMPPDDAEKAHIKRWRLIKAAIEQVKPDIVFIDGLRDLLSTINDEETAVDILSQMATIAEEQHMCIWNALHQNPRINSDGEDSKMRGWVGTELGNKVTDTLISHKKKDGTGVTFTVKQQDARGKDLDDWMFEVTEDAGNLGVPRIINSGYNLPSKSKEQVQSDNIDLIRGWIYEAQKNLNWPLTRAEVKTLVFRDIGGVKNNDRLQADLIAALNTKLLRESAVRSGNGSYKLEPDEVVPF